MVSKKSNFSGFLDGYKAGNITSFANTFRYKKFEIKEYAEKIVIELEKLEIPDNNLGIEVKALSATLLSSMDNYEALSALGDSLKNIKKSYIKLDNDSKLKVESFFQRIVFHFLELAKKCENEDLLDLAIDIGEDV